MKWTKHTPDPKPDESFELRHGSISVNVSGDWQSMMIHFGKHDLRSQEESFRKWPREAISLARKALDDFESKLEIVPESEK